jgi:Family of unknown function (DUF6159)
MEHRGQGLEPESGTRRGRGWRLTKASWRLARRDPTLAPLALLAIGCLMLASIGTVGLIASFDGPGQGPQILLTMILGGFLTTAILVFFSSALSHAASGGFEGLPLTMREAMAEARTTLGPIALWSLIALAVTVCLQLLGASGDATGALGLLLGLAWGFLVTFVIPIISLAGAGAGEAIGESSALARRRWGEQISGGIAIFVLTLLAALGWGIVCGFGSNAIEHDHEAIGAAALVIGGLGMGFTVVLSFATGQAFTVALFRFDGGELSLDELESPPPAAPIGRSAVFRVAGVIAGLLVMATLVGVILPHPGRHSDSDLGFYVPENGWYYATFSPGTEVPLSAGSPVIYRERQVGVVVESRLEPERVVVWFRADPTLEEPIEANPKTVGGLNGSHYLQVGPRDGPEDLGGPA